MRQAAKTDTNQTRIVKALRAVPGCDVLSLAQLKKCFDILVFFKGKIFPMEIKNPDYVPKKGVETMLSEGEREFKARVEATGNRYYIVTTPEEALRIILGNT